MISRHSGTVETTFGPWQVEVEYTCSSDPGNCSGPVECCYPPEEEMEITSIKFEGEEVMPLFDEDAITRLEEACWQDASDAAADAAMNEGPDRDDY